MSLFYIFFLIILFINTSISIDYYSLNQNNVYPIPRILNQEDFRNFYLCVLKDPSYENHHSLIVNDLHNLSSTHNAYINIKAVLESNPTNHIATVYQNLEGIALARLGFIDMAFRHFDQITSSNFCLLTFCNYLNIFANHIQSIEDIKHINVKLEKYHRYSESLSQLPCLAKAFNNIFNKAVVYKGFLEEIEPFISLFNNILFFSRNLDPNVVRTDLDIDYLYSTLAIFAHNDNPISPKVNTWWAFNKWRKEENSLPFNDLWRYHPLFHPEDHDIEANKQYQQRLAIAHQDPRYMANIANLQLNIPRCIQSMDQIPFIRQNYIDNVQYLINYIETNPISDVIFPLSQKIGWQLSYHNLSSKKHLMLTEQLYKKLIIPNLDMIPLNTIDQYKPVFSGQYLIRKIRIGFLSNYLSGHSVGRSTMGVIENLPRNLFDVIIFGCNSLNDDVILNRIYKNSTEYYPIFKQKYDLNDLIKFIRNKMIDIMVFPEIGMHLQTYLIALYRVAPIHVSTWGHSDTSGITHMDYYISSKHFEKDLSQSINVYSENLIAMNSLSTYYYENGELDHSVSIESLSSVSRFDFLYSLNLPITGHLYFLPSMLWKLLPIFDSILLNILKKDHEATIVLFKSDDILAKCLSNRLNQNLGGFANRIRFINKLSMKDFLTLMFQSHVVLDSYPFGICNGAFDAFSMGRIVVTLPGDLINGRFVYGLYQKMDLLDLVATTPGEYVDLAVKIAVNDTYRINIQEQILQRKHLIFKENETIEEWTQYLLGMINSIPLFIQS